MPHLWHRAQEPGCFFTNLSLVSQPLPEAPSVQLKGKGVFLDPLSGSQALRWLLAAFAGFVAGQLFSTGLVTLMAAIKGQSSQLSSLAHSTSPPEWYILSSLFGLWAGFLGAAWAVVHIGRAPRHTLGIRFSSWDLLGIPIGIGAQILIGLMYLPFRSHLKHFDAPITKLTGSSHGSGYVIIIFCTLILAPIIEEIFFRGVLFRSLAGFSSLVKTLAGKRVILILAVLLDGLLFGVVHGELIQLPGLALFGALLAVLFYRTGRLGLSIVTHIAFNSLAIISYTSSSGTLFGWH